MDLIKKLERDKNLSDGEFAAVIDSADYDSALHESADRVRRIKEETGARILCGIMPFVSLKNATFMKNEMAGIDVTDEVLARYRADMTREEGEQAGVQPAKEVIVMTEDFADGYYFSFPFNRVTMLEKILN